MTHLNKIKNDLFNYIMHDNFNDAVEYLLNQNQIIKEIETFDVESIVEIYQILSYETRLSQKKKVLIQEIENKSSINPKIISIFRDLVFSFFQRKYSKCIKSSEEIIKILNTKNNLYEYVYYFYLSSLTNCTLYSKAISIYKELYFEKNKSPLLQLVGLEINEFKQFLNCPDLIAIDLAENNHHNDSNELLKAKGILWLSIIDLRDFNHTKNNQILQLVQQQHQYILSQYTSCPEILQYFIRITKSFLDKDNLNQVIDHIPDTKPEKYQLLFEIESKRAIKLFEKNRSSIRIGKDYLLLFFWLKNQIIYHKNYNPQKIFEDIIKHEPFLFDAYLSFGNNMLKIDIEESIKIYKKAFKLQEFSGDSAYSIIQSIVELGIQESARKVYNFVISNCSNNSIKTKYLEFLFNNAIKTRNIKEVFYITKIIMPLEDNWLFKNINHFADNIEIICKGDQFDKEIILELVSLFALTNNIDSQNKLINELETRGIKLNQNEKRDMEVIKEIKILNQKTKEFKFKEVIFSCEKILEKEWIEMIASICLSAIIQTGALWKIEDFFKEWLKNKENDEIPIFIGNYIVNNPVLIEWNITFDYLLEITPNSSDLYTLYINKLGANNDFEKATMYCKQAIEKFAHKEWYKWKLGDLFYTYGDKNAAKELWNDLIANGEYQHCCFKSLSQVYEDEGDDFAIIKLLESPLIKRELHYDLLETILIKLNKTKLDNKLEYIALYTLVYLNGEQKSKMFGNNNPINVLFNLRNNVIETYKNKSIDESKLRSFSDKIIDLYGSKMILGIWINENEIIILINPINYNDEFINHINRSIEIIAKENSITLSLKIQYFLNLLEELRIGRNDMFNMLLDSKNIVDFGTNTAFTIIKKHMNLIIEKFDKYLLGYSIFGSFVRGEATKKSDLDAFFILDDTDIQKMTRGELKGKVFEISNEYTTKVAEELGVNVKLNIQVYLLTEFWLALREGNPLIISILKDSVPFYDKGIIRPWKSLFEMGEFIPSKEATDKYLEDSRAIISNLRGNIIKITIEQLFNSNLMIARAALMSYNIIGTHPRETVDQITKYLCLNKKVISKKSTNHFKEVVTIYKKFEHGEQMTNYINDFSKFFLQTENFHREVIELVKKVKRNKIISEFDELILKLNRFLHENYSTNIDLLIAKFQSENNYKISNSNKFNDFLLDFVPTFQSFQKENFNLLIMEILINKWLELEPAIEILKNNNK